MVTPPPYWPGSQTELAEFLAIVRDGCKACGLNRTLKTPCKDHLVDAVLARYDQKALDLLVGEKHDPYWMGPQDRARQYTPRKED